VITAFVTSLNDAMNDTDRQALKPLIPALPASRGDADLEGARSWTLMDWHCRTWTSTWLRAAGCFNEAALLERASLIRDGETLSSGLGPLRQARAAATAKRVDATRAAPLETLGLAVAASDVDTGSPALKAVRDAISSGSGWPAMWKAVKTAGATGPWRETWDASGYRMSVAAETAQIAAVRALSASSAWNARWDTSRTVAQQAWDHAREEARSTGRDAALAVALGAAWPATENQDVTRQWSVAAAAAEQAVRDPVAELRRGAIELVGLLVGSARANVSG